MTRKRQFVSDGVRYVFSKEGGREGRREGGRKGGREEGSRE